MLTGLFSLLLYALGDRLRAFYTTGEMKLVQILCAQCWIMAAQLDWLFSVKLGMHFVILGVTCQRQLSTHTVQMNLITGPHRSYGRGAHTVLGR